MLEIPLLSKTLAGFRAFRPLAVGGHQRDPQKALHAWKTFWAIIGFCATLRRRKNRKRFTKRSRMCEGAPVQPIVMIFGTARDLTDVINRANLCIDLFRVSDLEVSKLGPPIGNRNGRLTSVCCPSVHTHDKFQNRTIMQLRVWTAWLAKSWKVSWDYKQAGNSQATIS